MWTHPGYNAHGPNINIGAQLVLAEKAAAFRKRFTLVRTPTVRHIIIIWRGDLPICRDELDTKLTVANSPCDETGWHRNSVQGRTQFEHSSTACKDSAIPQFYNELLRFLALKLQRINIHFAHANHCGLRVGTTLVIVLLSFLMLVTSVL